MDFISFKPSSERAAEALEPVLHRWRAVHEPPAPGQVPAAHAPPPFTIALCYEAGTDGPGVARAVGARLGWRVYDRELIGMIAEQLGLRPSLVESADEKPINWLEEFLASFFDIPDVSEPAYVEHLARTLLSLAARGECVLVGRGAAQFLPEETTLRVRLVGPLKDRVAAVGQHFGFSHDQAAHWVGETERRRRSFVKDHFLKDPADPDGYDLLPNMFRFPAAACVELIVQALRELQARAPASGRGGSGPS